MSQPSIYDILVRDIAKSLRRVGAQENNNAPDQEQEQEEMEEYQDGDEQGVQDDDGIELMENLTRGIKQVTIAQPKPMSQTQLGDQIAVLESFLKGPIIANITTALTKATDYSNTLKDTLENTRKKQEEQMRDFTAEILAEQKAHASEQENNLKALIDNQTVFKDIRESNQRTEANIEERLSRLSQNLNGNLNLIIQRLMTTGDTVTSAQKSNIDLMYKQCLNKEEIAVGGHMGCVYYNCNHIGNGDFAARIEDICIASPSDPVIIHACMFHEQMIKAKPTLHIVTHSRITDEKTSFISVLKYSSFENNSLRRFALSNTLDSQLKNMMYLQLLKDIFGTLSYPDTFLLAGQVVFKLPGTQVDKLLTNHTLDITRDSDPGIYVANLSKITVTLDSYTKCVVKSYSNTGIGLMTIDLPNFKHCLENLQKCRFMKFLLPDYSESWSLATFVRELQNVLKSS